MPGARIRSRALAKALACTGAPSLKRKPLLSVNVYVRRSAETRAGPAATSYSRAHVVSTSSADARVYSSAGSSGPTSRARATMRTTPPDRASGRPHGLGAPVGQEHERGRPNAEAERRRDRVDPSRLVRGGPEVDAGCRRRIRSISASSSSVRSRRSSAATFSSSCSTLEAPISVEVMRGSRSVQASASWARLWPRPAATSFSARTFASVSSVEQVGRERLVAARPRALRDSVQVAVGQQALRERREADAASTDLLERVEEAVPLEPAVQHRVGRLVDQQRRAELAEDRGGLSGLARPSRRRCPTYSALPC